MNDEDTDEMWLTCPDTRKTILFRGPHGANLDAYLRNSASDWDTYDELILDLPDNKT
jgi:hypothetical protein